VTGFELVLHGDARLAPEPLQRRMREMATLPQIRTPMHGAGTVDAAVARVDWVLAPSLWWESAPRSVEAAFRAGRPVICSDRGGLAERVTDGVNGLHVPLGDPDALAAAMARCLAEPDLWDQLAAGIPAVPGPEEQLAAYRALWSAAPVELRQTELVAQARAEPVAQARAEPVAQARAEPVAQARAEPTAPARRSRSRGG
jgi:glycosyltransferase involved in cell wall biosynthesis